MMTREWNKHNIINEHKHDNNRQEKTTNKVKNDEVKHMKGSVTLSGFSRMEIHSMTAIHALTI